MIGGLITISLTSTVVLLCGYLWNQWRNKRIGYPDGPTPLPMLGNLHQVIAAGDMVTFLEKYRKLFGNVYSVELGGEMRVVVSGYDQIYDLLVKKADNTSERSTRAMPEHYKEITDKTPGLFWAPAPNWKTMRSFALSRLREEGMGKATLEPRILEELHMYLDHFIEPNLGQPIEMTRSITYATSNIILQMVAAKRYDYEDAELRDINRAIEENIKASVKCTITQNIPLIKYLPGDPTGKKSDKASADYTRHVVANWITAIREMLENSSSSCFIERAICHTVAEDERKHHQIFNDENVGIAALQLFVAGTETTATALRWALLFMITYPDIQDKVREEIDEQIGTRAPTSNDRRNMPYTDAVLLETIRIGNIAPTALPHTLNADTVIDGKTIPAGAELMINMASMLHDEKLFPEPNKFKPERFMGPDADYLKSRSAAFGLGRRACLGESLARMEMFIFFTTFLQKYRLRSPHGDMPSVKPNVLIVSTPHTYKIIFERR